MTVLPSNIDAPHRNWISKWVTTWLFCCWIRTQNQSTDLLASTCMWLLSRQWKDLVHTIHVHTHNGHAAIKYKHRQYLSSDDERSETNAKVSDVCPSRLSTSWSHCLKFFLNKLIPTCSLHTCTTCTHIHTYMSTGVYAGRCTCTLIHTTKDCFKGVQSLVVSWSLFSHRLIHCNINK